MSRWPTEHHFASWTTLPPTTRFPAGACSALGLHRPPIGPQRFCAFYRRLAARVGKAKAITATARKLAVLVYRVLSGDLIYNDRGATAYHQLNRARELKSLRKRAKLLGFDLVDRSSDEVLLNPVS
jgi:transposase